MKLSPQQRLYIDDKEYPEYLRTWNVAVDAITREHSTVRYTPVPSGLVKVFTRGELDEWQASKATAETFRVGPLIEIPPLTAWKKFFPSASSERQYWKTVQGSGTASNLLDAAHYLSAAKEKVQER